MTTRIEARDYVYSIVETWAASADVVTAAGAALEVKSDDRPEDIRDNENDISKNVKPWARVVMRHEFGGQSSLGDASTGARYERLGTVFLQIFTPRGQGLRISDQLVILAKKAFDLAPPGGVAFRNVRDREVGPDGSFFQVLVLASFMYDEVQI